MENGVENLLSPPSSLLPSFMSWLKTNWRVLLRVPVLIGLAVFLFGLVVLLRSFVQSSPELVTVDLAQPSVTTKAEEVELTLYETETVSSPLRLTLELPSDPLQRYTAILTALRDNLATLWPQALALPDVFWLESGGSRSVTLHFTFDNPIAVTVMEELRLYQSIVTTLQNNGANQVHILVNDNADTFLGHIALGNSLD
jgi:hypothetical protein